MIDEAIETIRNGCKASARWETKKSGLETLRKIAKSILLCTEPEIKKGVMDSESTTLGGIADALEGILDQMGELDLEDADRIWNDEKLLDGVRWLHKEYRKYQIDYQIDYFGGLVDTIDVPAEGRDAEAQEDE